VLTASIKPLYRVRSLMLVLACVAPVVGLGLVWLLVTQVLLVPSVPGKDTPADAVAQFIMHEQGLPRLDRARAEAVLAEQVQRLVRDARFRERFAAEYRVSSPEEQKAFRENLFAALKPLVMDDIRSYDATPPAQRPALLDERIVKYNRLSKLVGSVQIDKNIAGPAGDVQADFLATLMGTTTEEERRLGLAYGQALAVRVNEILADPVLKADFEARIAAP